MTDFRIIVSHTPEANFHDWVFLPEWEPDLPTTVRRDSLGRKNRGAWRTWVTLMCNNTECAGRAIVPASLLTDVANSQDEKVNRP
jgi:hypothetical protein